MDIPQELHNSETGGLIEQCLVCHKNVVESGEPYFLEKIARNVPQLEIREVLFEYAMCMNCAESMREELSRESLEKIEQFMQGHDLPVVNHSEEEEADYNLGICAVTEKSLNECLEFAYHAVCIGTELHPVFSPYAISDTVMDEIGDQLSQKTVDALDDFKGRHFTGPPEVAKLISSRRLISI